MDTEHKPPTLYIKHVDERGRRVQTIAEPPPGTTTEEVLKQAALFRKDGADVQVVYR